QLEPRVPAYLRALDVAGAAAAAIADDEDDERHLDEQEDRGRHAEDQPVDRADVRGARRGGRGWRHAAVPRRGRPGEAEREQRDAREGTTEPGHGRWHSTKRGRRNAGTA